MSIFELMGLLIDVLTMSVCKSQNVIESLGVQCAVTMSVIVNIVNIWKSQKQLVE